MEFLFAASATERTLQTELVHANRYEYTAANFCGVALDQADKFLHGNRQVGEYTTTFDRYGREVLIVRTR